MATHTLVTSAALTAVQFSGSSQVLLPVDLAAIANAIKTDPNAENGQNAARNPVRGAFSYNGLLYLPWNRGVIRLLPGDVVAVDTGASGWPIVISNDARTNGNWTFT